MSRLAIVLHAHCPYVLNHGRWPHGSDWLCESAAETYLPLLGLLRRLREEGIRVRLTVGLTPVLTEQLASAAFAAEFGGYLERKLAVAGENEAEFERQGRGELAILAAGWRRHYDDARDEYRRCGGNIVAGFREFQDQGIVEVLTSAATHAYMPLLGTDESLRAQIGVALATHRRHFGRGPRGFWLPECGYRPGGAWVRPAGAQGAAVNRPGLERGLADAGLEYVVLDSHAVTGGRSGGGSEPRLAPRAAAAPAPGETAAGSPPCAYRTGSLSVLVRDTVTAAQVWSGATGYPGDPGYLEFHKTHHPGGLRYWRITGPGVDIAGKRPYEPGEAASRVADHARHFVSLVESRLARAGEDAVLAAPYDAELFGHWWHEGIRWLEAVIRNLDQRATVELVRAGDHLERHPPSRRLAPAESSWGSHGGHDTWLNAGTRWAWAAAYRAEDRLVELAARYASLAGAAREEARRPLAATARSLLLVQASDWTFMIGTGGAADYAEARLRGHLEDFDRLAALAERVLAGSALSPAEDRALTEIERRDFAFPGLDPAWWSPAGAPAS